MQAFEAIPEPSSSCLKKGPKLPYHSFCKFVSSLNTQLLLFCLTGSGVTVNCVHPGVVATELGRHTGMHKSAFSSTILGPLFYMLVKTPTQGAQPSVFLSVAEELKDISGKYFDTFTQKSPAAQAKDVNVAKRLWQMSAELVGLSEPTRSPTVATHQMKER
ncbi:retinol dehydrogenase 13-like [Polypterus senegalus]|uniref:retinol dehydrogenase 13-like n=1 Tax=Polypterus senegalus TaxID=55291 RepID=UPI001964394A|nr:retinol dehydrogenase 13-like [Polypterus senegalus]